MNGTQRYDASAVCVVRKARCDAFERGHLRIKKKKKIIIATYRFSNILLYNIKCL